MVLLLGILVVSQSRAQTGPYTTECLTNVDNATVVISAEVAPRLPNGASLAAGDTVVVRSPSGDCVGYGAWADDGTDLAIAAAGATKIEEAPSGLTAADSLAFEVFDESQDNVVTVGEGVDYVSCDAIGVPVCNEQGTYQDGGVFVVEGFDVPAYAMTVTGEDGTDNDAGWRMLALPAAGATRGDLADDIDLTAVSGMLYQWDGTQWVAKTEASDPLPRGTGLILYFFDDETDPVTTTGLSLDVDQGTEDQTVDKQVTALNQQDEWHLMGNPYDVGFDLGSFAGGDLGTAGFQATVQVWDPGAQEYRQIIQGTSGDDLSAWQGFFVQRSTMGEGQTSLTFGAGGRQSGSGSLIGSKSRALVATSPSSKTENVSSGGGGMLALQLQMSDNDGSLINTDRVTYWSNRRAKTGYDAYEAEDLSPPDGGSYATATLPIRKDDALVHRALGAGPSFSVGASPKRTVPLSVRSTGTGGTATLAWPESLRSRVPENWTVQLIDTEADSTVDLRSESYAFSLSAGQSIDDPGAARFRLALKTGPLPFELSQFQAEARRSAVSLQWSTASERNTTGFELQRRGDGAKTSGSAGWTQIGFVKGSGTTEEPQAYAFQDKDLPYAVDTLRYRLRQTTTNGKTAYSDPILVTREVKSMELLGTYPNPAREQVTVRYAIPEGGAEDENARFALYDVMGRRVLERGANSDTGRHEHQLSLSGLASGVYFLRLKRGDTIKTQKLTVIR